MIDHLCRYALPAAFDVLPASMRSRQAAAMLLAIALQESKVIHRRQVNGPARGFWQFERAGVTGVLTHQASRPYARTALVALCYPAALTVPAIHATLEHNDVLACVFARLLLWTLPDALPAPGDVEGAWLQYVEAWRPGRPYRSTWSANYRRARTVGESLGEA